LPFGRAKDFDTPSARVNSIDKRRKSAEVLGECQRQNIKDRDAKMIFGAE
jgi:hypothetical protein